MRILAFLSEDVLRGCEAACGKAHVVTSSTDATAAAAAIRRRGFDAVVLDPDVLAQPDFDQLVAAVGDTSTAMVLYTSLSSATARRVVQLAERSTIELVFRGVEDVPLIAHKLANFAHASVPALLLNRAAASLRPMPEALQIAAVRLFGNGTLPRWVNGLADAIDSANTARISAAGELSTADAQLRTRLDAVLVRLNALSVSMPGGVAITNLPAVQPVSLADGVAISNLPAVQPVSGTVMVGNQPAVTVVSSAANPVHVSGALTVQAPVNLPYDLQIDLSGATCHSFTVPPGTVLVTETITAMLSLRFVAASLRLEIKTDGRPLYPTIALTPTADPGFEGGILTGTHTIKLYIDGGVHQICRRGGGSNATGEATIFGYLITDPW